MEMNFQTRIAPNFCGCELRLYTYFRPGRHTEYARPPSLPGWFGSNKIHKLSYAISEITLPFVLSLNFEVGLPLLAPSPDSSVNCGRIQSQMDTTA